MKNIELLKLEGKLANQEIIDLIENDSYLTKNQIEAIMALGESGLQDMRIIMQAYLDNIEDIRKSENTLCPFYHIQSFMTDMKDEQSYDLMMDYVKSDYSLLDDTFSDSIMEDLPSYHAMFPHRMMAIEKELYNKTISCQTKELIVNSLVQIPTIHQDENTKQEVIEILQNQLKFLSIPENRKDFVPPPKKHEWTNLDSYIAFQIHDLYNLGADVQTDYIKSLFEQEAVDESIFGTLKNLLAEKPDDYTYYNDIFERNKSWQISTERDVKFEQEYTERQRQKEFSQKMQLLSKEYGRNDKVSVKYNDGKILTDVKYKKIEDDIRADKCQII